MILMQIFLHVTTISRFIKQIMSNLQFDNVVFILIACWSQKLLQKMQQLNPI